MKLLAGQTTPRTYLNQPLTRREFFSTNFCPSEFVLEKLSLKNILFQNKEKKFIQHIFNAEFGFYCSDQRHRTIQTATR